jgi:hypothetical protein
MVLRFSCSADFHFAFHARIEFLVGTFVGRPYDYQPMRRMSNAMDSR